MTYYFVFILSLIFPLHALPLVIFQLIKKNTKYISIFSFALAFSAIAYTVTPQEGFDITRHWAHMHRLEGKSLQTIISESNSGYLVLDIYIWIINKLQLPKEFLSSSIVFIAYFINLLIYKKIRSDFLYNASLKNAFSALLLIWLPINFIGLSSGLRSGLASALITYAIYQFFFYKKRIVFFTLSIFSFFIHPFSAVLVVLALISYFLPKLSKYSKYMVVISIGLILSERIVNSIIAYLISLISNSSLYSPTYFDTEGIYGAGASQHYNINGIITTLIIPKIPVFIGLFYLLIVKIRDKNPLYLLLCLISLYLGIFFSFNTLYARMSAGFIGLFGIFIIIQYSKNNSRLNKYTMNFFILSLIVYSLVTIHKASDYFISSLALIYKPFLFLVFDI